MGLVVGALVIMIFGLCTLATGFMLYYFRMRYPHVQGFGQAGYVLAGRPGQWIAEVLFQLLLIFVMAAHILTFSTMANTVAGDSWKCTVVFKVIGLIICLACTLPRTFKSNSYLSAICKYSRRHGLRTDLQIFSLSIHPHGDSHRHDRYSHHWRGPGYCRYRAT